jgi:hypothetical protein
MPLLSEMQRDDLDIRAGRYEYVLRSSKALLTIWSSSSDIEVTG